MPLLVSTLARRGGRSCYRRAVRLGICFAILVPGVCRASASPTCDTLLDPATVVLCALAASPELRSQEQEVQVLGGQRLRARSLLPSHPTLQVSLAGRRPPAAGGLAGEAPAALNWYLSLSQEIEIAGQRGARVKEADAALAAQRQRVLVAAQEVASAALGTYYDALAASEAGALGKEVAAIAEQLASLGAARAQAALIAPVDAHIAQAEAARYASLRYEAERRAAELGVSLAAQLGQPALRVLHGSLDTLPGMESSPAQTESLIAQALLLRGDLAAARYEQAARAARVQVIRRERAPNLTLSFTAQRDGFDEQVFGGGLSFPLPLPAPLGPSRAGEILASEAQVAQAGLSVERLRRQIRADVLRAVERERSYALQVRGFPAELVAQARADLAALAQALTAHQLAPRDALLAQRSLVEFLMGHLEARRGLAQARVERLRATGQPLVPTPAGGPQ